jgi:hypothetical protein
MDKLCPFGFLVRIQPEDDLNGLLPVGAFFIRVEQAQIRDQMALVIRGEARAFGRFVVEWDDRYPVTRSVM